jgi:hypothetical protein
MGRIKSGGKRRAMKRRPGRPRLPKEFRKVQRTVTLAPEIDNCVVKEAELTGKDYTEIVSETLRIRYQAMKWLSAPVLPAVEEAFEEYIARGAKKTVKKKV